MKTQPEIFQNERVAASAGSGKTYALTNRFIALAAKEIDEIRFTNKSIQIVNNEPLNIEITRNVEDVDSFITRSNTIRLYVRGKLAVENLMNYIDSNQALAKYIEGELSFDVLDDDEFDEFDDDW